MRKASVKKYRTNNGTVTQRGIIKMHVEEYRAYFEDPTTQVTQRTLGCLVIKETGPESLDGESGQDQTPHTD